MCGTAAFMVASMAMSAVQAQQQAQAAQAQADYEQAVQRNNNIMAERAKQDALRRGKREETLKRLETAQEVSTKRGQLAGSGFNVNTGSALTAQSDIKAMGGVEAQTIRSNARREAYGIDVDNARERAGSAGRVSQFKNQKKAAIISGASNIAAAGWKGYDSGAFK